MEWGFDRRLAVGGLAVSVVIAVAGLGVTILWPDQKFLGWGLLWASAIIFVAWIAFEITQWVGKTRKAVLFSAIAATVIFGSLFLLQWKTGIKSEGSKANHKTPIDSQPDSTPPEVHQEQPQEGTHTRIPISPKPQPTSPKHPKDIAVSPREPSKPAEVGPGDKPEVALSLVNLESPAISLQNISNAVASNIKWGVVLWDTTNPNPDWSPLQIPVQTFDWIKPGERGGPEDVFSRVSSQLKPGDVLIGSAFVDCPDCIKGHTYLVEILWGQGGWYAEWAQGNGNPAVPVQWSMEGKKGYFAQIEAIPLADRIAITPQ